MAKHYIDVDTEGRIIHGFSDIFEEPKESSICINEEGGRHFELNGVINPNLVNEYWCHLYAYENEEIREATEYEINVELEKINEEIKSQNENKEEQMLQEQVNEMSILLADALCELSMLKLDV